MKKFYSLLIALLCSATMAFAYEAKIDGIYYDFDHENKTAGVTSGYTDYYGNIIIPEKVTYNGIEYTVTSIGSYAFDDTPWLNNQPDGCVCINNFLYTYKGEMPTNTHIDVNEGTTMICSSAFSSCSSLTSITIPNSVISIGDGAFEGCSSLTSVTIPNSVTEIGDVVFRDCIGLKYAKIGSGVKYIGAIIFYCDEISSLDTLICEFGDDVELDFYESSAVGTQHSLVGAKNLRYFEGPAKLVNLIKEEF